MSAREAGLSSGQVTAKDFWTREGDDWKAGGLVSDLAKLDR